VKTGEITAIRGFEDIEAWKAARTIEQTVNRRRSGERGEKIIRYPSPAMKGEAR